MTSVKHSREKVFQPLASGIDPFGRFLNSSAWLKPLEVRLDGDRIRWGPWESSNKLLSARTGEGLLEGFVQLADAPAATILKYVRKWGVLGICRHGLPCTHPPSFAENVNSLELRFGCAPLGFGTDEGPWEPLESWRGYSRLAKALLTITVRLHGEELQAKRFEKQEEWSLVGKWPLTQRALAANGIQLPSERSSSIQERSALACVIQILIDLGRVDLCLRWRKENPSVEVRTGGLFGALAVQLLMSIGPTDGIALCSGCGSPYSPERQPNPNRRQYCPRCRKGKVPQRDAARASRRRQRGLQS